MAIGPLLRISTFDASIDSRGEANIVRLLRLFAPPIWWGDENK
jgi:hypothetical protein